MALRSLDIWTLLGYIVKVIHNREEENIMKKIIALLLCVSTVALTMVGCGSASTEAEAPAATEETAEATDEAA